MTARASTFLRQIDVLGRALRIHVKTLSTRVNQHTIPHRVIASLTSNDVPNKTQEHLVLLDLDPGFSDLLLHGIGPVL